MKPTLLLNLVLVIALIIVSVKLVRGNADRASTASCIKDSAEVVFQNILNRTSVRTYKKQSVEDAKIEMLLKAGMAAPSALNIQPWHFIVVKDSIILNKIAEVTPNAGMAKEAPLAIVVCGDMQKETDEKVKAFWPQDVAAVSENILLQAHSLGLGAVWTGTYPSQERCKAISDLLKLPDYIIPFNTIVIGYPTEKTTAKDKWKPQNISYNYYGGKDSL